MHVYTGSKKRRSLLKKKESDFQDTHIKSDKCLQL